MTPILPANALVSTADCAIFGVLVVDADMMGTISGTAIHGMAGASIGTKTSGSRGKLSFIVAVRIEHGKWRISPWDE